MSMMVIKPNQERDPHGKHLRALLYATMKLERLSALRALVVHGLAIIGVFLWLDLAWGILPQTARRFALAGYASILVAGIIAGAIEWHWARVRERCLEENDAVIYDGDDG